MDRLELEQFFLKEYAPTHTQLAQRRSDEGVDVQLKVRVGPAAPHAYLTSILGEVAASTQGELRAGSQGAEQRSELAAR